MKLTAGWLKQRSCLMFLLGAMMGWTVAPDYSRPAAAPLVDTSIRVHDAVFKRAALTEWPKSLALAESACATPSFGPPIRTATGVDRISGSVVSDFNGDGYPDVAVADRVSGNIAILLGDGFGTFKHAPGSLVMPGPSPSSVLAAADFNGDGQQDLAIGSSSAPPDGSVKLLLGDGTGRFNAAPGSPVTTSQGIAALVAADFNGDGRTDLVAGHIDAGHVTVLLGDGGGGLSVAARPVVMFGVGRADVAVAEFNGDNRPDLAVINTDRGLLSILLGKGDGSFDAGPGAQISTGEQARGILARDFNRDGHQDLAVAVGSARTVKVFFGQGNGEFSAPEVIALPTARSLFFLVADDFNLDGAPDLAIDMSLESIGVLLGDGKGSFSAPAEYPLRYVSGILMGDFNHDGRPDLLALDASEGAMKVMFNTCTSPPVITCPADVFAATGRPGDGSGTAINYPAPGASGGAPGATVICSPPAGSIFPLGATDVTCTATDANGATASCGFRVNVFDVVLQDDQRNDHLLFNSFSGEYRFTQCASGGITLNGRGLVRRVGCTTILNSQLVRAEINDCLGRGASAGAAMIKLTPLGPTLLIGDRDIGNNTSICP